MSAASERPVWRENRGAISSANVEVACDLEQFQWEWTECPENCQNRNVRKALTSGWQLYKEVDVEVVILIALG